MTFKLMRVYKQSSSGLNKPSNAMDGKKPQSKKAPATAVKPCRFLMSNGHVNTGKIVGLAICIVAVSEKATRLFLVH